MKLCPVCQKQEAIYHRTYGYLPCTDCEQRRLNNSLPAHQVEFTSNDIKEQRKMYAPDIIQPFRGGEVSKEFIDRYGSDDLQITEKEKKKAKNVWR